MVKNKHGRTTRLILSALVLVVVAGATTAGLLAGGSASQSPTRPTATTISMPSQPTTTTPAARTPSATTPAAATPTATAPASTSPATTTTPAVTSAPSTTEAPAKTTPMPAGIGGSWKLAFSESFNGDSLNQKVWNPHNGWTNQNGVTDSAGNVKVTDGHAVLTLSSGSSGAELGTRNFSLKVGEFAQARIKFAGTGHTIYNWPAFWLSGPDWPQGGENDIAEGFGALTVSYHSPELVEHSGAVSGDWAGSFHTFGIYRGRTVSKVYWDGKLVETYKTQDDGAPETLLLTLGAGNTVRTGSAGAMVIDYVRAWRPAQGSGGQ